MQTQHNQRQPRAASARGANGLAKRVRTWVGPLLLLSAMAAQADLARVGPSDIPSPPGNGFPLWYQDLNGLVLDLCLPTDRPADPNDPQLTACLLTPFDAGAGVPPPPYVFPTNFPEEVFYYRAVSDALDTSNGAGTKRAVLVLALEAAFANGGPVPGDQVVFTRIRVTAGVPEDGDYTVTHPYGTETFTGVVAGVGNRDITFTEDVGIGAPGVFSGALSSRVGPFLVDPANPSGVELPAGSGRFFLGDGVTLTSVSGSPFGTDYFEICGTRADGSPIPLGTAGASGNCARTDLFTLTGLVHNLAASPIGSPLSIDRATYARDGASTQVDVVATATAGVGQAAPVLSAAAPEIPPVLMDSPVPNPFGSFYAQGIPVPPEAVPGTITVTNTADVPPSSATKQVVDAITILEATYAPDHLLGGTLTVVASSSDKGDSGLVPPIPVPTLVLEGFPAATALVPATATPLDPASVEFTATGIAAPPLSVTVTSSAGGQGRADVAILTPAAAAFAPGHPFAQADVATVAAGDPAVAIPVLDNDSVNPAGAALNPASVTIAVAPVSGSATPELIAGAPTGRVLYTPPPFETVDTFSYTVRDLAGNISNMATVTVDVTPAAGGFIPTAVGDAFAVTVNTTTALAVLANDLANGGTLDPASVTIVGPQPPQVTGVNPDGTIQFVAGASPGIVAFQYSVRDVGGTVASTASVAVDVVAPEVITVTTARCRVSRSRWRVTGTSTGPDGTLISLFLPGGELLGTAVVGPPNATGVWDFNPGAGGAACATPISLQSSLGTTVTNIPVVQGLN